MSKKAISSVVVNVILLLVTISLVGVSYLFSSGYFSKITQQIAVEDATCSWATVTIIVRNLGNEPISYITVTQTEPAGDMAEDYTQSVPAGGAVVINDICLGKDTRTCSYLLQAAGGATSRATVQCMAVGTYSNQGTCHNAEFDQDGQPAGLCSGLDVLFGAGYMQDCCDEWGYCCG
jgi:flagellin-like protein